MQWYWAALLLFGLGVGLMMLGIPVAIAFFATNIVAAALFMGGGPGIVQVINNGFGAMTSFALVPIPMFLLMGELFYHTGLATKCFNAADKLLANVRGPRAYRRGGTADGRRRPTVPAGVDVRRADLGMDGDPAGGGAGLCARTRVAAGKDPPVLRRRDPDGSDHRLLRDHHDRRLVHA